MATDLAAHACVAQAQARLPAYMQRQRWLELVEVIASEIQELDDAIVAVTAQLHLDHAEGAQLDLIGREVNEDRGGREDADYRAGIRIRIAVNRSRGLAEDVIRVARLVLDTPAPAGLVELQTVGAAAASLTLGGTAAPDPSVVASILGYARATVAAGVRLAVTSSSVPDADTFRLAGGLGTQPIIDFGNPTGGIFDTVVGLKLYGASANDIVTLSIRADAGAPADGAWITGFPAFLFHVLDGVTTIADFEAAVATQSDYLEIVRASTLPGVMVDGDTTFGAINFYGAEDAPSEPGEGFGGTLPYLELELLTGSGFTTIIGLRSPVLGGGSGFDDHGASLNATVGITFYADAGAPGTGILNEGGVPDLEFMFKPGVTTIADFEAAVAASELLYLVAASSVSGLIVDPDDAIAGAYLDDATGSRGGAFAHVQE